ncbi:MAG: type II toxin-antitoxin system RelE/ParE family toxin [Candidatus Wildermuthbacteria bacterium]|nr:type II toxin-antitoxin system RelE/ParE family toxin [Candidatus Wildermuthbacteria bacterium]
MENLRKKEKAKVSKYIEFLRVSHGYLDEPYSKHIKGKIRELRVDFARNRHRIFYFTFIGRKIILLHVFLKKTAKTPNAEIRKAEANYQDILVNPKNYE